MADLADAELLLPLTKFLTADKRAASNSTAVQTTGTLPPSVRKTADTHSSTFGFCQHTDQNKKPTELEFCQRSKKKQKSNAIY